MTASTPPTSDQSAQWRYALTRAEIEDAQVDRDLIYLSQRSAGLKETIRGLRQLLGAGEIGV